MEKLKGILLAIISASLFGIMPILATCSYEGGLNSFTLVFLRYFFATFMLLAYVLFKKCSLNKQSKDSQEYSLILSRKQMFDVVPISIFGYILTALVLFASYNYIDVGLATVLHFTYPTVIIIVSIFIFKEKVNIGKIISLSLSILGIILLVGGEPGMNLNITGVFLSLISGIFYAYYILGVAKSSLKYVNTYVLTFYLSAVGSLALFILGVVTKQFVFEVKIYSYVLAVSMALINSVFAVVALQLSIKIVGPSTASILSTFEPIVGVLFGILLLNEPFTIKGLFGVFLIILSVIIVTLFEKKSSCKTTHLHE